VGGGLIDAWWSVVGWVVGWDGLVWKTLSYMPSTAELVCRANIVFFDRETREEREAPRLTQDMIPNLSNLSRCTKNFSSSNIYLIIYCNITSIFVSILRMITIGV
jgi:hypothetical protein